MKSNPIDFLIKENDYVTSHFKNNPLKDYKKILIVGASGLVGLNILATLINFTNKFNSTISIHCISKSKSLEKFLKIKNKKQISFFNIDITKKKLDQKYDLIIFCAGYSAPHSFTRDKNTLLIPSIGLNNTFQNLKKNGKLIYFSSSEIYNGLEKNFTENKSGNINFDNARATYINGKKFGETLSYNKIKEGYSVLILRLSLAYGPGAGLTDKRVLNDFILKALEAGKIKMLDQGVNIRKYIFISDVIIYLFKLISKNKIGAFNISGKSRTTILNLAKTISKKTNANLILPIKNQSIPGAPKSVNISIKKINKVYKLKLLDFNEGLNKTIKWYKFLLKK